jgi:hypothetical protein
MNRVICIVYAPGAYGSFIGWALDRFNAIRKNFQPAIMDNPLQPDGSSHGYASFCKVRDTDSFMEELEKCRNTNSHWGYSIYGGWPAAIGEDVNAAIHQILHWMNNDDRIIFIERPTLDEVFLCWLNNETKMTRERWYGMLDIRDDEQLTERLQQEIDNRHCDVIDSCIVKITVNDILQNQPTKLLQKLYKHLNWDTVDELDFTTVHTRMVSMQNNLQILENLYNINATNLSPAQESINKFLKEYQNGLY